MKRLMNSSVRKTRIAMKLLLTNFLKNLDFKRQIMIYRDVTTGKC